MELSLKSEFDLKEIEKHQAAIKVKQSEIKIHQAAIRHYQNLCGHPNMQAYRDYGGGTSGYCSKCGYSC